MSGRSHKRYGRTLAFVRWNDACSTEGPVHSKNFNESYPVDSAGILVRENAEMVTLAQQIVPTERERDGELCRDVLHIPKAMIVSMKKVRV